MNLLIITSGAFVKAYKIQIEVHLISSKNDSILIDIHGFYLS